MSALGAVEEVYVFCLFLFGGRICGGRRSGGELPECVGDGIRDLGGFAEGSRADAVPACEEEGGGGGEDYVAVLGGQRGVVWVMCGISRAVAYPYSLGTVMVMALEAMMRRCRTGTWDDNYGDDDDDDDD